MRGLVLGLGLSCTLLAACPSKRPPPPLDLTPTPDPVVQALVIPAAPADCTVAVTLQADQIPHSGRVGFRQVPGELDGPDWGACVWLGPTEEAPSGLWVLMIWRPAWQGEARCWVDPHGPAPLRSPRIVVGPPDSPIPDGVRVKHYQAMEGAAALLGPDLPVPSSRIPCEPSAPALQGEDTVPDDSAEPDDSASPEPEDSGLRPPAPGL